MRSCYLFLFLLGVFLAQAHGAALPEWPVPPQQKADWGIPANVPTNLISAAQSLFAQGFPDPRGCEYREIEINVSTLHNPTAFTLQTHGWILPLQSGSRLRQAIAWNGVIYTTTKIGGLVDLQRDIADMPVLNERYLDYAKGEERSALAKESPAIRALLLLRLSDTNATVKHWVINRRLMGLQQSRLNLSPAQMDNPAFYDPYVELANDWAWSLYDHVLSAHMRGDVTTALAAARQLNQLQAQVENEAKRRNIPHLDSYSSPDRKNLPYLDFLERFPALLTDLERRFQQPATNGLTGIAALNLTDPQQRIAGLIAGMDQIQERQLSQPGIVQPQESAIGQALIKAGEAAVEPLLECMEKDKRMTRSVGYSRDFQRNRVVISVSRAACMTLQQILRVDFNTAPEMRAYWSQNKGLKPEERWYQALQNDAVGTEQWVQAAASIVQPDNETGVPHGGYRQMTQLPAGQEPQFRGESLRRKQGPSVTELLVKRAEELVTKATKTDQSMAVDELRGAYELTLFLAQWEPKAAAAPARKAMHRAIELSSDKNTFIMSSGEYLARYIAKWTQMRLADSDTAALAEYTAWLKTINPSKYGRDILEILEPVWSNPKAPEVTAAGEWLFADDKSPWAALLWQRVSIARSAAPPEGWKSVGIYEIGLPQIPAFRRLLLAELDNQEEIGWLESIGPNQVASEIKGFRMSQGIKLPKDFQPPLRIKIKIRHGDWLAWSLSNAKQIPLFNPFASLKERDAAILEAKKTVEAWP